MCVGMSNVFSIIDKDINYIILLIERYVMFNVYIYVYYYTFMHGQKKKFCIILRFFKLKFIQSYTEWGI